MCERGTTVGRGCAFSPALVHAKTAAPVIRSCTRRTLALLRYQFCRTAQSDHVHEIEFAAVPLKNTEGFGESPTHVFASVLEGSTATRQGLTGGYIPKALLAKDRLAIPQKR